MTEVKNDVIPAWKVILTICAITVAGVVLMTIAFVGCAYLEEKYELTPWIDVDAKYSNLTTISINFSDFGLLSFSAAAGKIDHVDIRIDGDLVDTIAGTDITTDLYYYTVNTDRHWLVVKIVYKNGESIEHVFSNSMLEVIRPGIRVSS